MQIKPLSLMERREKISHAQGKKILRKSFSARQNNQRVVLYVQSGAVSDFDFVGDDYVRTIQSHISDVTKAQCGSYSVIQIEKFEISPITDDITAKLLSRDLISQLQLINTIVIANANFIFDDGFFGSLGFKKLKFENGKQYFYWVHNRIANRLRIAA